MDTEDLLFLLYTSGTTGKPKGIMHTMGGYLTHVAFTHKYVFDLHPETDVFWCTADVGWVTGHSYIVYGPLANGATQVMYEGVPNYPGNDRFWEIIEKYGVTKFYTAPTAIRTFMKWGDARTGQARPVVAASCSVSVGEPINPEAWMWYHEHIGGGRCPIVDTWWQTETGGIMISPLPGAPRPSRVRRRSRCRAYAPRCVDDDGERVDRGGGYLTLTRPWPGMLRGIWGDPERYPETYWSRFPGRYFAGDGAKLDDDGYLWLLGRVDDVMNVSGHRISHHRGRIGARVASGRRRSGRGRRQRRHHRARRSSRTSPCVAGRRSPVDDLRDHVAREIGAIAKPKTIFLTPDLPKTAVGQDHAPPAARRRRGPQPRRHHDARRRVDRRRAAGACCSHVRLTQRESVGQRRTRAVTPTSMWVGSSRFRLAVPMLPP